MLAEKEAGLPTMDVYIQIDHHIQSQHILPGPEMDVIYTMILMEDNIERFLQEKLQDYSHSQTLINFQEIVPG